MKWRDGLFSLIVMAAAGIIIFFSFQHIVQHPAGFLFSKSPDALKNYYNFAYYLKYGNGLYFEGQNYPYGEHLLFTDSHPGLVLLLNWIDDNLIQIHDHAVGLLNLTMLGSIILGAFILFFLARKLSLPRNYAVLISLIITFLSPQLPRIQGHFSLSQSFWIPLFLYGWWNFSVEKKTYWALLLCISGLIAGFIHPYYAGMYTAFGLSFWISLLLIARKRNRSNYFRWQELVVAILPLILIKVFVMFTDPFSPRPQHMFGFFSYYATPGSILLPDFSSIRYLVEQYFSTNYPWEGRSFIGSIPALFVIFTLIAILFCLFTQRWNVIDSLLTKKDWNPFILGSLLVLFFSMCFPFRFGFEFLVDWFPQIKQFRALGRFSWIFYYVISIYTGYYVYLLYRWLRQKQTGLVFPNLCLVLVLILWSVESLVNIEKVRPYVFNNNDKLEPHHTEYIARLESTGHNPIDFQAILALPFTSTTADKLLFENGENNLSEAFKCSWHTGLPLLQNLSPRNILDHGLKNVQLLSNPLIPKSKLSDLTDKPILLVSSKVPLADAERELKSRSKLFWEDEFIQLASLPIETFSESRYEIMAHLDTFLMKHPCDTGLCMDRDSGYLLFQEFDTTDWQGTELTIWEGTLQAQEVYNISFWLYINDLLPDMPSLTINSRDEVSGVSVHFDQKSTRSSFDVLQRWSRISFNISPNTGLHYELKLNGEKIRFDRLLIKPLDSNVLILSSDSTYHFNNYPVKLN